MTTYSEIPCQDGRPYKFVIDLRQSYRKRKKLKLETTNILHETDSYFTPV